MLTRVGISTIKAGFTVVGILSFLACPGRESSGGATPDTVGAAADTGRIDLAPPTCSAAELDATAEATPGGLPAAVADTRRAILRAAVACDYDRLEELALSGDAAFTYSFGDDDRPAEFWRQLEATGEEPLSILVRTLSLPWARESLEVEPYVFYVWPSAYLIDADDAAWEALAGLYTPDEIELFREYGSFIGWRVGITEAGQWRFFVAGD